jgi:hypothetical protein
MTEEEIKEYVKCARDPVYFLNTYGFVYDIEKQRIDHMTCYPYQEETIRKFNDNQNNIVLKSRQMGLSVLTAGYVAWKIIFNYDESILIVANKGDSAVRMLDTVRRFLDHVPAFLLPSERPENNTKKIRFSNNSWVKAVASSKDAGRGESLTMLVLDETAFIEHADDIWIASGGALSVTQGKCIMISTPKGTGGLYHGTWMASKKKENDFVRSELHWSLHPVLSKDMEERTDELGKKFIWSPWYGQQCEKYRYDTVKIAQELDLSFEGSAAMVIENHVLEKYEKDCQGIKPVCWYDFKNEGTGFVVGRETSFLVWEKPKEKTNYIIAADVGRGDGSDYSTIQILDADNLTQVAEYQGKIAPDIFANVIDKVGREYNKAFVAVECNSFGLVTALMLKKYLKYDPNRIYHSKSVKKVYIRYPGFDSVDENSEIPGFQTTMKSRPLVIGSITKYMRSGEVKLRSTRLLDEFKTFVFQGDKAEHTRGYHDDLIIALGIALFMRETEFDNVFRSREFYGAMLNSISRSDTGDKFKLEDVVRAEQAKDAAEKLTQPRQADNGEDISWLYGPIKG